MLATRQSKLGMPARRLLAPLVLCGLVLLTGASPAFADSDLAITQSDSADPVQVGDTFDYTFDIDYLSGTGTVNPHVHDFVPDKVEIVSLPPECSFVEGALDCDFGEIGPGGGVGFSFTVRATEVGTLTNTAIVSGAADSNSANNTSEEETTVIAAPPRTLTVSTGGDGSGRVTSNPAGIDCGSDCSEDYLNGTTVTLVATPLAGSTFAGWGGNCAGSPGQTCTVDMDGAKSVSASFSAPVPPPPAPVAVLKPSSNEVPTGGLLELDASETTGATQLLFDFNSDGSNDMATTPDAPFVAIRVRQPATYDVTMTAVSPIGTTSSTTQRISVAGTLRLLAPRTPETGAASSQRGFLQPPVSASLPACAPNSQVVFGVVELRGCLSHVLDPAQIPAAERAIAGTYIDIAQFIERAGTTCKLGLRLSGCAEEAAKQAFDVYVSKETVKINGMVIKPKPGASIAVFPASGRIVSSNAEVTFDGDLGVIPVMSGKLNLDLHSGLRTLTGNRLKLPLFDFDAKKQLPDIAGFPIDTKVELSFRKEEERRFSSLMLNVNLPTVFKTFGDGPQPSAKVRVDASNDRGVFLGELDLNVPEAFIGPLQLTELRFKYKDAGDPAQDCPSKSWKATAKIYLLPEDPDGKGAGLSLAPQPPRNGVAFCAGEFQSAGADLTFGDAAPQIFPGVFLEHIAFNFQLDNPLLFDGGAGITAAKIVHAEGGILAAFASPRAPYIIKASDANQTLGPIAGKKLVSTAFAAGGKVSIDVPVVGKLGFGEGYLLYAYPNYIAGGGRVKAQTFIFSIESASSFEINTDNARFNVSSAGEVCLAGGIKIPGVGKGICTGGLGQISSRGIIGCLYLPKDVWEPGLGFYWTGEFEAFLGTAGDGCKPSHFAEQNVQGLQKLARRAIADGAFRRKPVSAAGAAPIAFKVNKGDTHKNIHIDGAGGPPAVTVTAPDGETLASETDTMNRTEHLRTFSSDQYDATWVGVDKPVPGTYLITPTADSPAITAVSATDSSKDRLKASLKKKGRKLVLSYDVGSTPGQVVRFYEKGTTTWRELASAKRGKGRKAFTAALGPAGQRQIVAMVEVDGLPAEPKTVATFTAPPPPTAGKVKGVRARRAKSGLKVSWRRAPNAVKYKVTVFERGGKQIPRFIKASKRTILIKGVAKTQRGSVKVAALGPLGDWGKAGTGRFKATKKVKDRLLSFASLKGRRRARS